MRNGTRRAVLFAMAAALVAWAAWPGSADGFAASVDRVDVITMVVLLGGLPLLARRVAGPPRTGRGAAFLLVGWYAAILALIPAKNVVEQSLDIPPGGRLDLRLYRLIADSGFGKHWLSEVLFLVVMALYAAAILWLTSQRSRVAPATLAVGAGAGLAAGVVLYAVAPLGLSNAATNPWLPGSDVDPLVALAWILMLFAPVAAAVIAYRHYTASGPTPRAGAARQVVAAGALASLVSALFVTVAGTGTIAAMLKAASLRAWLYHDYPLAGVGRLRLLLRGHPGALVYSHQITAAVDAPPYLIVCVVFPVIALMLTGLGALIARASAAAGRGGDPPPGGGTLGPAPVPDPPDSAQLASSQPMTPTRRAAIICQHEARGADAAITDAIDAHVESELGTGVSAGAFPAPAAPRGLIAR